MLEQLDNLIATLVGPLQAMGFLLNQQVNLVVPGSNGATMHMGTAALTAFVMPWIDAIGPIITAVSRLLNVL